MLGYAVRQRFFLYVPTAVFPFRWNVPDARVGILHANFLSRLRGGELQNEIYGRIGAVASPYWLSGLSSLRLGLALLAIEALVYRAAVYLELRVPTTTVAHIACVTVELSLTFALWA